ncbi:MAG: MerR family transcriptional regulator [Gammaproteobacteria bacterium]|nr:MerR family transcriptional regulator [Gammaproteobacteria bacterium]
MRKLTRNTKSSPTRYDKTEPLYTLSVASRLSGVSVYTMQQWINKGLILPFKTPAKRNLFSDVDVKRLQDIRGLIDEQGLNIAGIKALYALIPCWVLKHCTVEDRKTCQAYDSTVSPCWDAAEKGPKCKQTDCRTCEVYSAPTETENIKSLLRKYYKQL